MNTPCPFDLEKILSDCELQDVEPIQAVAWRRVADREAEAIILCRQRAAWLLVLVEQWSHRWRVDQIATEDEEFIKDLKRHPEMVEFFAHDWMRLEFDDFYNFLPKITAYSHFPKQEDLRKFMDFSDWNALPLNREVVWEGKQGLPPAPLAV